MIYKNFQDLKLSALGMGAMRLPVVGDDDGVIDEAAATAMVATAMKQGLIIMIQHGGIIMGSLRLFLEKL